jgi:hypothetical protein
MTSLAVPLYSDPVAGQWDRAVNAGPRLTLLVANIAHPGGPSSERLDVYAEAIGRCRAVGQTVLGYVHATYGRRPVTALMSEATAWSELYPDLGGIFVDQVPSDAGVVTGYLRPLYDAIKARSGSIVVLNPGVDVEEQYLSASDVLVNFEGGCRSYLGSPGAAPWVSRHPPDRFWHIVYDTPAERIEDVVATARSRNAGYLFITPLRPPDAYTRLPVEPYWRAVLATIGAG